MNRRLSIHEAAEAEINEAADFYDAKSPGLGRVFLGEIERAIGHISEFPGGRTSQPRTRQKEAHRQVPVLPGLLRPAR